MAFSGYNLVMNRTGSTLAIVVLLGAGWVEHDALAPAPPHIHTEIPPSVTPTLNVPISASGGHSDVTGDSWTRLE